MHQPGARVSLHQITVLADTARFRPDDPDALVQAALACPLCLCSSSILWEAALDGYDPTVECHCRSCDEHWRVYVAPYQALRLSVLHH